MKTFTIQEFKSKYAEWKLHLRILIVIILAVQVLGSVFYIFREDMALWLIWQSGLIGLSTNFITLGYIVFAFKKAQKLGIGI
jgi:hypothetical protein